MIEIESLTFAYGRDRTPVFEDFTWRASPGEAWSITGPSGCGKSTLLYLIAGLRRPQAGRVLVGGFEASARENRGRVGLVLQDYGLLPWATAWDNARLGLRVRRLFGSHKVDLESGPHRWLRRLGVEHLSKRYPAQLSGGERQRVAIARALALEPRVLLLDEPFSALDAPTRESLEQLTVSLSREPGPASGEATDAGGPLQSMEATGGRAGASRGDSSGRGVPRVPAAAISSLLFVTHSIEEAAVVGQRILVLGSPPNRSATVIDNPMGGGEWQPRLEFGRVCQEIRAALGCGARP